MNEKSFFSLRDKVRDIVASFWDFLDDKLLDIHCFTYNHSRINAENEKICKVTKRLPVGCLNGELISEFADSLFTSKSSKQLFFARVNASACCD